MSLIKEILSNDDYQILATVEINIAIEKAESSKGERREANIKYLEYLWTEIVNHDYENETQEDFMMNLAGHLYEKMQQM